MRVVERRGVARTAGHELGALHLLARLRDLAVDGRLVSPARSFV